LVTRLSAIQESASMDVLCTDKTGTLTLNRLQFAGSKAYQPFDETRLLELAALASDRAGQDPIDLALLTAAEAAGVDIPDRGPIGRARRSAPSGRGPARR